MKEKFNSKVLIVDGNSLFYRSYYATMRLVQSFHNPNPSGVQSNAIFTSIRMLEKFINNHSSYSQIFFTWDLGKKTFRHLAYPNYKATRKKTPDELIEQIPMFEEFLKIMKIAYFKNPKYEADDLVFTITNKALKKKLAVDVISSDRDLLQVVQPHVNLFLLKTGTSEMNVVNSDNFYHKFQLFPDQIIDFKALIGDKSDNLSGVKGIGPKKAIFLLNKYKSLKKIYQAINLFSPDLQKKLLIGKKQSFLVQNLVKLRGELDVDVQFSPTNYNFQSPLAQAFYRQYKMFSLLKVNKQNKFDFE